MKTKIQVTKGGNILPGLMIKVVALMALSICFGQGVNAQQKDAFRLEGQLDGLPDGELYLGFGTFGEMKADTVTSTAGKFIFQDSITEPCFAMLFNHDYSVKLDLYLDKGNIQIQGDYNALDESKITGSPVVNEYAAYMSRQLASRKPVQAIYEKWMQAYNSGDSAKADVEKAAFMKARNAQGKMSVDLQKAFMKDHPGSIAAAWELLHYIKDENLKESIAIYDQFTPAVKSSLQGKELAARIATLSRVQVGNPAPGFEQQALKGDAIRLADYKGKYVLLEFWASWCAPCRAESPNVLKAYEKYKGNGFDVLSVSLDDKQDKWAAAVKKDGLVWKQVSDLKGWKNEVARLYGIQAVPANFLIDPNGKIIAQNLRGDDLQNKLENLFKKAN